MSKLILLADEDLEIEERLQLNKIASRPSVCYSQYELVKGPDRQDVSSGYAIKKLLYLLQVPREHHEKNIGRDFAKSFIFKPIPRGWDAFFNGIGQANRSDPASTSPFLSENPQTPITRLEEDLDMKGDLDMEQHSDNIIMQSDDEDEEIIDMPYLPDRQQLFGQSQP